MKLTIRDSPQGGYYASVNPETGIDSVRYLHKTGKLMSACHTLPDLGVDVDGFRKLHSWEELCKAEDSGWCASLDEAQQLCEKFGHTWEVVLGPRRMYT